MATPSILKSMGNVMTTTEAAATIGVHRNTIWNAIKIGHIPYLKIGNAIVLDPEDVKLFRARYLRGEVTSTSVDPAKRGRPLKVMMTMAEAAVEIGILPAAVRKAIKNGLIPAQKVGRVIVIDSKDVGVFKTARAARLVAKEAAKAARLVAKAA